MDRYLVVSSDGHAGPHAADYREYVSPKYRDAFDAALPIQIAMTETMAKQFLVDDINRDWRQGNEDGEEGYPHPVRHYRRVRWSVQGPHRRNTSLMLGS